MTGVQIPLPAPHHNKASDLKEETESVLEALGYKSVPEGMEMNKVRISKSRGTVSGGEQANC